MSRTNHSQGKGKALVSSGPNHHQSSGSSQSAVAVHGSSNWSGYSQTQNGRTSSSWVHQGSKVQLDVSVRGSHVLVKQQIAQKKIEVSKEKVKGFTKEVKQETTAKTTVTYKIDTTSPSRLLLHPKPNPKPKPKPKPNPVSQKAVTLRR